MTVMVGRKEEQFWHTLQKQQVQEWRELGMVGDDFTPGQIVGGENLIDGKQPNRRYQYLPIDTRYFKDLELRILGLTAPTPICKTPTGN